jgi:peptide/nickel transport system ATP-binding protein
MLTVKNLSISFHRYGKWLSRKTLHPIKDLNLSLKKGQVMAVVGESGAGKSLLAHAILGLLPKNAVVKGSLLFNNEFLTPEKSRTLRGKEIALIPQSISYLNPLWSVGGQVCRAAVLSGVRKKEAKSCVHAVFSRYSLEPEVSKMLPFQISGGMARRVLTASAVVGDAQLIIADEPTTGLDASNINHSLNDLKRLAKNGKAILLITHDIAAALRIADTVAVFKDGATVEIADASSFDNTENLIHPYSKQLFEALPQNAFINAASLTEEQLNYA